MNKLINSIKIMHKKIIKKYIYYPRWFIFILACLFPLLVGAGEIGNLTYSVINNEITITGNTGISGDVVIPATIEGKPVTSIGDQAFLGCSGITNITIPNSVTSIGNQVFHSCTGLTSITIPDKVTNIEFGMFYLCSGLTSITIPDGVTSIGDSAFHACTGLTNITIPDGVTSIGNQAFYSCSGLN